MWEVLVFVFVDLLVSSALKDNWIAIYSEILEIAKKFDYLKKSVFT